MRKYSHLRNEKKNPPTLKATAGLEILYFSLSIHFCAAMDNTKIQQTVAELSQYTEKIKECVCKNNNPLEPEKLDPRELKNTEFLALLRTQELVQKIVEHCCRTNSTHEYVRRVLHPEMYTVVEKKKTETKKKNKCSIFQLLSYPFQLLNKYRAFRSI